MPKIFIEAKFFLQHLISVLKQWVFIIGFIPWAYDYLSSFFPEPLRSFKFPKWFIYCFLLSAFLIASYRVWAKEKQEKEKLIRKLKKLRKSPVDFEISYEIKPVQIKIDKVRIAKEIDFIKKRISEIKNSSSLSVIQSFMSPDIEKYRSYRKAIKNYENEIKKYNQRYEKFYNVHFQIKNIGFVYDENIGIKISLDKGVKFRLAIDPPTEFPQRPKSIFSLIQHVVEPLPWFLPRSVPSYRTNVNIEEHYLGVDLKDLRAGEKSSILYHGVFIELLKRQNKLVFEFEIKSKKLKTPLKKEIIVDLERT